MKTPTSPSLEEVLAFEAPYTHVALTRTLMMDASTPLALFATLGADRPRCFLLESVDGGELTGRYSVLGVDVPKVLAYDRGTLTIRTNGHVETKDGTRAVDALREFLAGYVVASAPDLPRFAGGLVGYLGFDCLAELEPVPLPDTGLSTPEACFLLAEELVVYDRLTGRATLIVHASLDGDRRESYGRALERLEALARQVREAVPSLGAWEVPAASADALEVRSNRTSADYRAAVARAKEAIAAGEVFQVVLSQRFTVDATISPFTLYRALRAVNPSPYMFLIAFDDFAVVGASPEVMVRLQDDDLFLRPIAGTRRRGRTPAEDAALERELLGDDKELAEHRMLLDLGRNDLGRVAVPGTVRPEAVLHVERYAHVMHLVSDVHATRRENVDAFDVLRACFPAGTVSGAPKIRAAELIAELEPDRRGIYAGAVGSIDFAGNMDTCIAIRTAVVERDRVHFQAGAGIVYDSVPESEDLECHNKARSGLTALAIALQTSAEVA